MHPKLIYYLKVLTKLEIRRSSIREVKGTRFTIKKMSVVKEKANMLNTTIFVETKIILLSTDFRNFPRIKCKLVLNIPLYLFLEIKIIKEYS